jgi:hypothetical protein
VPFRSLVHIGWHLAVDAWHHGYASEGAAAVLYRLTKADWRKRNAGPPVG